MGVVGEYLLEEMAPILSEDMTLYVEAVASMFAQVETYATDWRPEDPNSDPEPPWDREAWSVMLDVDRAPAEALAYLAQYVGVTIPVGTVEAAARALIRSHNGMKRGTPEALRLAGTATLTGAKALTIVERASGDAYLCEVYTRTSETPSPAVTNAALQAVKPAGVIVNHYTVAGESWNEATHTWNTATGTWDATLTVNV